MTWDPTLDPDALAARIDHTLLQPDATEERIRKMLGEARALGVAGACVAPCWLPVATEVLAGTAVRVVAVVGFPLGSTLPRVKAFETREAVRLGADEIDAVVQIGWLASGRQEQVIDDVRAVVEAADGRPVKSILETGLLSAELLARAAGCAERGGASFVKTSTGFGPPGASVEAVRRLRGLVGHRLGVKASGGIRTLAQARALLDAGADRLGTSRAAEILAEARATRAP